MLSRNHRCYQLFYRIVKEKITRTLFIWNFFQAWRCFSKFCSLWPLKGVDFFQWEHMSFPCAIGHFYPNYQYKLYVENINWSYWCRCNLIQCILLFTPYGYYLLWKICYCCKISLSSVVMKCVGMYRYTYMLLIPERRSRLESVSRKQCHYFTKRSYAFYYVPHKVLF